jgi:hypothetical protein
MSELAFNINGEAFEVPANATGWRVRRMRPKGAPEVVYAREGQPLVLPITAGMDELRAEVETTGRYRLDPVDHNSKSIADAPCAYVQVNFETQPAAEEGPSITPASFGKSSDNIVLESMRMQSLVAVAVVERFPQMMEAAATLLRAADGAGLPARPGMALPEPDGEDDEDGETDEAPEKRTASMLDVIQPMVGPAVQYVVTGLMSGQLKLPGNLGAMFDWRKAAAQGKKAKVETAIPAAPASNATATTETPAGAAPVPSKLQNAQHFVAIQEALGPEDAAFARTAAANLTPTDIETWLANLGQLSVEDAVKRIRSEIAKAKSNGGAS